MISIKERDELDIDKYDACVASSIHSSLYAFSWYLDLVSDQWSALILDDYKATMPLPWNSKLGLKYITQPFFCQQLGIYSSKQIDESMTHLFVASIPPYFLNINLNTNVPLEKKKCQKQTNYILDLNRDYEFIFKKYRKDRKKSLRKSLDAYLYYQDFENKKVLMDLYQEVFGYLNLSDKYYNTIASVIDEVLKRGDGFIRNVFHDKQLVCSGFFIHFQDRIYYLFGASNQQGKKVGATTFLIDSVIKQFANTEKVFDFEGSNIQSIASFYKSFGSENTVYYKYSNNVIQRTIF